MKKEISYRVIDQLPRNRYRDALHLKNMIKFGGGVYNKNNMENQRGHTEEIFAIKKIKVG